MVIETKGDTLEIAPGVEFIERERTTGPTVHAIVVSDVEVNVDESGMRQFRWTAKVLPMGYETDYLVTEGYEVYGPALYAIGSEKYRMRFMEEALSFDEACNIKPKKNNTMENRTKFGKSRFQIRLYAFAWTILEKRDKEFDAAKTKEQNWIVTILKAMNFATEEENKVIKELVNLVSSKPDEKDELGDIMAALEGKSVIYDNLNPRVLLEEREFLSDKKSE